MGNLEVYKVLPDWRFLLFESIFRQCVLEILALLRIPDVTQVH